MYRYKSNTRVRAATKDVLTFHEKAWLETSQSVEKELITMHPEFNVRAGQDYSGYDYCNFMVNDEHFMLYIEEGKLTLKHNRKVVEAFAQTDSWTIAKAILDQI